MIVGMSSADLLTTDGRTEALKQLDDATERLLRTAGSLGELDIRAPSLLPGWTRAHVLAHLARNAEALSNLLRGVRTGRPAAAYASQEARDAAIDSAALFRGQASAVPDTAWDTPVRMLTGPEFPVAELLVRRLVEVELHHVDLGLRYGWRDWPESFAQLDLGEPMRTWRADRMT